MGSILKRTAIGFAILLLTLVIITGAAWIYVQTDAGRRSVADMLESVISSEMKGSFEVGHLDELGVDLWVARDLRFRATDGDIVMQIDNARIRPHWSRLWSEHTIAFRGAEVDGALLMFVQDEQGLEFERALDSPGPDTGEPPTVLIDFADIRFQHMESEWRFAGAPKMRVNDLSGLVDVRTDEHGDVTVRFDQAEGGVQLDLPTGPLDIEIHRAAGRIHGGWVHMGQIELDTEVLDGGARVRLTLEKPASSEDVVVHAEIATHGFAAGVAAWGLDAGTDVLSALGGFSGRIDSVDHLDYEMLPQRAR